MISIGTFRRYGSQLPIFEKSETWDNIVFGCAYVNQPESAHCNTQCQDYFVNKEKNWFWKKRYCYFAFADSAEVSGL